jgi:hypothetical protein
MADEYGGRVVVLLAAPVDALAPGFGELSGTDASITPAPAGYPILPDRDLIG